MDTGTLCTASSSLRWNRENSFLCCPGGEKQREGVGDRPFPTQMAFTAFPRLGEYKYKEDTLIPVPSFFLYVYVPMHYICVYIHRYVFRWRDKIYININFSSVKTDAKQLLTKQQPAEFI